MRRNVFQAIADPSRRANITLIALQAMTPNAIGEHFDSSGQAVFEHLRNNSEKYGKKDLINETKYYLQ